MSTFIISTSLVIALVLSGTFLTAADQVLKIIATLMRHTVRAYDIPGRYGGDEFLIILPNTDLDNARGLAERIHAGVKEEPVGELRVTMSLGVVCIQEDDRTVDDMVRRADRNLYKAKESGRNRVVS